MDGACVPIQDKQAANWCPIHSRQSHSSLLLLLLLRTGTTSLPAELNRILNSIKDLDERSDGA
jgi:hypothetical protein